MQRLPHIYFAPSTLGGRGIFTSEFIKEGSLIEICPIIILPEEELPIIHKTYLHDYYFLWGEDEKRCAIALGFGSLYNHSYFANAEYIFDLDENTIDFYSVRDIEAGEEITVNYNGLPDDPEPVWFDNPDYQR
ncbi:MAG: SET domain-containing protein-lysine N-methyltransferase [Saprospiraceae bacterium]|nr:SET domain-containing protein-lysine N-methyltransferase [Saprospiraceae bacterium]